MEEKKSTQLSANDDLGILTEIEHVDSQVKNQKKMITILIVAILIVVVSAAAYIMKVDSGPSETELQAQENLKLLQGELSELQTHTNELEDLLAQTQARLDSYENAAEEGEEINAEEMVIDEPTTYIVKEGESLWVLAEKFYGSGSYYEKLGLDNDIIDPEHLLVGTQLTVNPK